MMMVLCVVVGMGGIGWLVRCWQSSAARVREVLK